MKTLIIHPAESKTVYDGPPFDLRNVNVSIKVVGLSEFSRNVDYVLTIKFSNNQDFIFSHPIILQTPYYYTNWRLNKFNSVENMLLKPYSRIDIESSPNLPRELKLQIIVSTR